MSVTSSSPARSSRRAYAWVIAIVVVIVTVWTVGWFVLRGMVSDRLDAELARLGTRGLEIACPQRSVGGYPFRIEVSCVAPTVVVAATGAKGTLGGVRAVGLVYNPRHLIFEADAPIAVSGGIATSTTGTWERMQSSVRLLDDGLARGSLAGDALNLTVTLARDLDVIVTARHIELHARPIAAAQTGRLDVELAALAEALSIEVGSYSIGPRDMTISADVVARQVPMVRQWSPQVAREWAAQGGVLDVRAARLSFGPAVITAAGTLTPDADGLLSGRLRMVASGLDTLSPTGILGLPPEASLLASGFLMFGKVEKQGEATVRVLELVLDRGDALFGRMPLGSVPPLF